MKLFRRVFTLEHLKANKLRYLHNGNEDIVDSFVFEMEIKVVISTITKKTIIDDIIMTIIQLVIMMVYKQSRDLMALTFPLL